MGIFRQVKQAITSLNPSQLRQQAEQPVRLCLTAPTADAMRAMEDYFVPPHLSPERRAASAQGLVRDAHAPCDVRIYDNSLLRPPDAFSFNPDSPEGCIRRILRAREELTLPLARQFHPFRAPAAHRIIRGVAKENALFCLATAIPSVIPLLSAPWAVGEFSSDAAFLTANQIRMAFQLAAASDRPVGYREQRSEIASLVAGSFGWRALARELVGKVPFGGGLIPKAGIAYAATFVVGLSLERLYRLGYGFTRKERRAIYEEALEHGKEIASMLLAGLRQRIAS